MASWRRQSQGSLRWRLPFLKLISSDRPNELLFAHIDLSGHIRIERYLCFAGVDNVRRRVLVQVNARNKFAVDDRLEIIHPSGNFDVQVTRLRRKIESDPKAPRYLQTVRGVGYLLAPD